MWSKSTTHCFSHMLITVYKFGHKIYPKTIEFIPCKNQLIRLMTFSQPQTPSLPLFRQLNLFKINELLYLSNIKIAFRALRNKTPVAVSSVLRLKYVSNEIVTRGNTNKMLERYEIRTSKYGRFSIRY